MMPYILRYIYVLMCFSLFLTACTETAPTEATPNVPKNTEKCKYGIPIAIFADTIAHITAHEFILKGQEGTEKVTFDTGIRLELVQNGCNNIRQSYNFYLTEKDDTKAATYWAEFAVAQFQYMANLDPSLFQLSAWGNAVGSLANQLKLGEKTQLEPGFYLTLDQLWTGEKTLVRVILESDN